MNTLSNSKMSLFTKLCTAEDNSKRTGSNFKRTLGPNGIALCSDCHNQLNPDIITVQYLKNIKAKRKKIQNSSIYYTCTVFEKTLIQ